MPSTLREQLIRLAHAKPELREHVLPMLREATGLTKKDFAVFTAETYFPVELSNGGMGPPGPVKGYLTEAEGDAAVKNLAKALKDSETWAKKYEDAADAGSGPLYETILRSAQAEQFGDAMAWVVAFKDKIKKAKGANSLLDVGLLYAPYFGPAYSDKFGGMLLGGEIGTRGKLVQDARWRAIIVKDLQKSKVLKELAALVETGATISDAPGLTAGVKDTVKALRYLKEKYDEAAEEARAAGLAALDAAVDKARAGVAKRYPGVPTSEMDRQMLRPYLVRDVVYWAP